MGIPVAQMFAVARYVMKQRLAGRERYPLVLMLEPLFRCNLACTGCGKIQYPPALLRRQLSVAECLAASDECGAPVVSIAGGEPLLHPRIAEIARGLVARGRFVYLCTNALQLADKLDEFEPDLHLSFSVHMDGPRAEHDRSVCRAGVYDTAVAAIRAALARGFRVTTNTTLFDGADPERMRRFFDDMMALGVEGMMISPGYSYQKAPDREHFLRREQSHRLFARMLESPHRAWRFNQSPLFLQFLTGKRDFECTPWGNPTYNIFGWQRPCYLLQDGYAATFRELMDETDWSSYGHASGNPRCQDCMVHCGFEPSAVNATFGSARGMAATIAALIKEQR
jgi:hopanoid biosynthesis associated radical SAM protein HpnH